MNTFVSSRCLPALIVLVCVCVGPTTKVNAGVVYGGLSEFREVSAGVLESDLYMSVSADLAGVGNELIAIETDVFHSHVIKSGTTTSIGVGEITFDAKNEFDDWQDSTSLEVGDLDPVPPRIKIVEILDYYSFSFQSTPKILTDTQPFLLGTFRVDYTAFNLGVGDSVTLDITGRNSTLGTPSTSATVAEPNFGPSFPLFSLNHSGNVGPGIRTFTLTSGGGGGGGGGGVIPEPSSGLMFLMFGGLAASHRRRRNRAVQSVALR